MALTKVEAEQLQPAQTSITSVGTLTGLTSSGTLSVTNQVAIRETAPGIQSGHSSAHSLQVGRWGTSNNRWMIVPEPEGSPLYSRELAYSFDTDTWTVEGSFAATLSTAAQPNITSVGTLTSLNISGALTGTTATFTGTGNSSQVIIKSTDADAAVGPRLDLTRDSASPADGDVIGQIRFQADNDAGEEITFTSLRNVLEDASDGAEAGSFEINTRLNGQMRSRMLVKVAETVFNDEGRNVDFRVESNGNANMLFVDGGNNSVGIGTASPVGRFNINTNSDTVFTISTTNSTADGRINFRNSAGTDAGRIWYNTSGNRMMFYTNSAERVRIDNSGNVLVGTTNTGANHASDGAYITNSGQIIGRATGIVSYLNRRGSDGQILQFMKDGSNLGSMSTNAGALVLKGASTSAPVQLQTHDGNEDIEVDPDGFIKFETAGSEAMRIDSSGNILLGVDNTTATNEGAIYFKGNSLRVTRDGNEPLNLNRLTNQGNLVEFRQAGTTRGLIGTVANDLFICSGGNNSGHNGLRFHANGILPTDDTGAIVNNDADLGDPSYRFKDIYIAGGIDFGAATTTAVSQSNVSSSSNLLDEYEEGQYTPEVTVQSGSATLNNNMDTLFYTKIGRQVTINGRIRFSTTSASGYMRLSLPFANVSNVSSTQGDYAYFSLAGHNVNVSADVYGIFAEVSPGNNYVTLLQKFDNNPWNYLDASAFSSGDYLYFAGSYFTNS